MSVGIYRITLGFTTYRWLCDRHKQQRESEGWSCELDKPTDQHCDDCSVESQAEAVQAWTQAYEAERNLQRGKEDARERRNPIHSTPVVPAVQSRQRKKAPGGIGGTLAKEATTEMPLWTSVRRREPENQDTDTAPQVRPKDVSQENVRDVSASDPAAID